MCYTYCQRAPNPAQVSAEGLKLDIYASEFIASHTLSERVNNINTVKYNNSDG